MGMLRRALNVSWGRNVVVTAIDNLTSLHNHEKGLRSRSLAVIEADAALSDH